MAWRKLRLASVGESAGHAVLVNSVCFQGGHAVGDWLVVGYDGQLTIRCVEVGDFLMAAHFHLLGIIL